MDAIQKPDSVKDLVIFHQSATMERRGKDAVSQS